MKYIDCNDGQKSSEMCLISTAKYSLQNLSQMCPEPKHISNTQVGLSHNFEVIIWPTKTFLTDKMDTFSPKVTNWTKLLRKDVWSNILNF